MDDAESAAAASGSRVDCRMWGKEKELPGTYPVVCHMLDTAAVFHALWDGLMGEPLRARIAAALGLDQERARAMLGFWAALHDVGKISPPFQAQAPAAFASLRQDAAYGFAPGADRESHFRHEMATHWALAGLFAEAGYPGGGRTLSRAVSHQAAQLLGGHHGFYGSTLTAWEAQNPDSYEMGLGGAGWADQRRAHFAEVLRVTGGDAVPQGCLPAELAVVVSGLIVVSDWLASQKDAIVSLMPEPGWQGTPSDLDDHWRRTAAAAPGGVRDARIGRVSFDTAGFDAMFPFTPNPLQKDLVEHLPALVGAGSSGLVLITAPTGDGKTEAALFAASVLARAAGSRGLYFALPTMATADGMYPRVRDFAAKSLSGERALTLLHSMAWLSPLYTGSAAGSDGAHGAADEDLPEAQALDDGEEARETSADTATALEADAWLRGARQAMLAALGVGTIDQALAGVLPLKHNALRLFALSDKVFVVDEAHAYGPWMHKLLTVLLEWLGAFGAPVVLLSATLTGRTAGSLVDAYRRGSGFLEPSQVQPRYPGWLFVDGATGKVSPPRPVASERERTIDVTVRPVVWDSDADPTSKPRPGGRREAMRTALRRVADEGGTALVCCTTVAAAQQTFRDLRAAFPALARTEGGLRLLHSRYPAYVRQEITADCEDAYGKPVTAADIAQPRPASILVATAVVEQSLDLDFDLVVSDLAPLAQLLQRVGRARRHARGTTGRPAWAQPEARPELVVLEPVDSKGKTERPPSWGPVYDRSLLVRTAGLLRAQATGIHVPGDVQRLVDEVYSEDFVHRLDASAKRELAAMDAERLAQETSAAHLAAMAGIDGPADVGANLHLLSRRVAGVTEELLTTRLGADTGRLLCLFEQPDGRLTLDEADTVPLPKNGKHGPALAGLAQIMRHVAPVPGTWLLGDGEQGLAPNNWQKRSLLRDIVLLRMRPDGTDAWSGRHGGQTIRISKLGLEQI